MTRPLVRAVTLLGAFEVVSPHHASETTPLGARLHVDILTFAEDLLDFELLPKLETRDIISRGTKLLGVARDLLALLFEGGALGFAGVLVLALTDAQDQGAVAILFLGALAHHTTAASDDGAGQHGAVVLEQLGHAHLGADDAGLLIHDDVRSALRN